MHKCQDYMPTGHQDTQVQASIYNPGQISSTRVAPGGLALYFVHSKKASGEQYGSCDSVIQIIGTRSSGTVEYLGATRSGSSFNFRPTNFTLPPVSEQYYVGDQPETQESQYSTFSFAHYVPCMPGQRQMGRNYFPMFPGQQQNNWEYQQQKQHPQNYQNRVSSAYWLIVHQSHRDLGQQVSSFFPSEHQDQFVPSNGDAAGSQMFLCKQQSEFHQMPLWLHGQQGTADSCTVQESSPIKTHSVLGPFLQAAGI